MAGPSIVVPAMPQPQRTLLPHQSHTNSASALRQSAGLTGRNAGANGNAAAPAGGRTEKRVRTRRVCSVASCANVLDRGWPWKRCRPCVKKSKAREVRKAAEQPCVSVDMACALCYIITEVVVHGNELKAGQPYLCARCRERKANATSPAASAQPPAPIPQQTPARPRNIVMHDESPLPKRHTSSLGHGPLPASRALHSNVSIYIPNTMPPPPPPPPLPPQNQFSPMPVAFDANAGTGASLFDHVRRFVHPNHRHILGPPRVRVPHPPSQISTAPTPSFESVVVATPRAAPQEPAVKRVRLIMPHYSRTGAILAVLPEDLGIERSSLPHAKASNTPPPVAAGTGEVANVAGSGSASPAKTERRPPERPRKVSVTHTEDGSIKLKIPPKHTPPALAPAPVPTPSDKSPNAESRSEAAAVPSPPSGAPAPPPPKKRKRALKPANRICESPGCENVIPPRFKGVRCVQCGFARWSTAFRERFDGIRAELIQAGITGPAPGVKQEARTPVVKEQPAAEDSVLQRLGGEAAAASDAASASPSPESPHATRKDGKGAPQRMSTVPGPPSGIPAPAVFRKPSIKSVKLIVSPRHKEPATSAVSLDSSASSPRTDTPLSDAADVPRPKIKSIKLRVSVPPNSHTTAAEIPSADTDDALEPLTSPLTDLDTLEDEEGYPMDVDRDREASHGDTTDSEASVPLARRYTAMGTEPIPDTAEAASEYPYPYPMAVDYDLEDHTGDTTDSEASVPLADWSPSHLPAPTPRSMTLPPIRRVRLILGPDPARALSSSSRESSPDLALSLAKPFSVRRRWEALGWDTDESELTPLEGSSDEGESEIDLQESSDDEAEGLDGGGGGDGAGTRLSIVIPRRVEKPPEKHRWQCATMRCANVLAQGSHFKNCDACRKRAHLLRKQEKRRGLRDGAVPGKYDDMEYHIPPDADLTRYRQCSVRHCSRLIPPQPQYRYRTCGPCRARSRRSWWKTKGLEPPDDDPSLRKSAKASVMERAIANAVRTAAKEAGFATGERMRNAVDESDARKEDARGPGERLMEMPPYQHFAALLESMHARFSQFKAVQARYVQLKALTGADGKPMVFTFDGEYSVVADPSGGSVDAAVNTVIRNVQAALELCFLPAGVRSGPEGSVIASLSGEYVAKIPQLSKAEFITAATGTGTATPPGASGATQAESPPVSGSSLEVTMAGELHVCVAWDRRHKFFPGQRVMLRFRLVG